MTCEVCIRFAPVFTTERMAAGVRPGRALYQRGALQFLPGRSTVPLLVDHDKDREVGVVHELVEWADTDGPWIVARATVTDPPGWLERGTKASFGLATVRRQEIDGWERVHRALVTEVSVLPPTVRPAEPLAEVVLVERTSSSAAGRTSDRRPAAGEIVLDHGPAGARVVRHGAGRVLAVSLGAGGHMEFAE
jgi:hypothetical protein